MSELIEKEAALFESWAKLVPEFSEDGIIKEECYLSSSPRIMLILKEVNNKYGKAVNLKAFLQKGAGKRKPTWDNVARWLYGIQNLEEEQKWPFLKNRDNLDNWRSELLPGLCVINLKKSPGVHTARKKEVISAAESHQKLLQEQFQLYFESVTTRPEIIIAGGTGSIFMNLVEVSGRSKLKQTSRGISYFTYPPSGVFVKYVHPAARVKDQFIYYMLIDALKEIKSLHA